MSPNGISPATLTTIKVENSSVNYYCSSYTPPAPDHHGMLVSGAYGESDAAETNNQDTGQALSRVLWPFPSAKSPGKLKLLLDVYVPGFKLVNNQLYKRPVRAKLSVMLVSWPD